MKALFTALFCTLSFFSFSQSVSQTIHQALVCTDIQSVVLQLEGTVEVRETKGSRILIETTVTLGAPNSALLQYLIDSGRYGIAQENNTADAAMSLISKKRTNVVMVKGQQCSEEVKYVVYMPPHIKYTQEASTTASSK